MVRAESALGLPHGPSASAMQIRPATLTRSLPMPVYPSPSAPSLITSSSPFTLSRSYRPTGTCSCTERALATSTSELMRGSGSPFLSRRSSASDDGRTRVGSNPKRRYSSRAPPTAPTSPDFAARLLRAPPSSNSPPPPPPSRPPPPPPPVSPFAPDRGAELQRGYSR